MQGPQILARTMSRATTRGHSPRAWQYHSRSDSHSKIACWTLLADMLDQCDVLQEAAAAGRVAFGINHVVVGPINKTLDLVLTRLPRGARSQGRTSLHDVAERIGVVLTEDDWRWLRRMPVIYEDRNDQAHEVAIALEAKACMTEHVKSLPRLHAEILATGYLVKRASPHSISVSYTLVNAAPFFVSPSGTGRRNVHDQPDAAARVIDMLDRAVPTLTETRDYGYDVVGASVIDCRNDGSVVELVDGRPFGVGALHRLHYERMVSALCSQFRARFGR